MAKKKPLRMVGDEWRDILVEITGSTGRGAAIIGAAMLDTLLEQLLRLFLVEIKGETEEAALFGPNGPLGTFGGRIRMSYYLGLISERERADLKTIQDVRNVFAHDWSENSFSEPKVSGNCSNPWHAEKWSVELAQAGWSDTTRDRFIVTVVGLSQVLLMRTSSSVWAQRRTVPAELDNSPPPAALPPPTGMRGLPTL